MVIEEYLPIVTFMSSAFLCSGLIALYIVLKLSAVPYPIINRRKDETTFQNEDGAMVLFPSIDDDPTIDLSIIIPAFDEALRLPKMLDEAIEYLESKPNLTYEIIVVSDGSRDKTVDISLTYTQKYKSDKFRVLKLIENRGKGGAVRLGMLSARGKYLLFADADGATKFSELQKLETSIKKLSNDDWKNEVIVIGSRAHLEEESKATRSFFRTILMHGFHMLVWLFTVKGIRDTQCGFKLFTRSAAKTVFLIMHVEKWAFDVEVLFIAQSLKMKIEEIGVEWVEIDGSKVTPFWSWLQMGRDLILIWTRYAIGAWILKRRK